MLAAHHLLQLQLIFPRFYLSDVFASADLVLL